MHYTTREVYDFISKQTNDTIIERKTCAVSGQPFPIYQSDLEFYEKIFPTFNGVKYQIPTPTLCPEERNTRRLARKNERKLYHRTCDFSGKPIISIYSPESPYTVYDHKIRWSDQRNPLDYGRAIDFNQPFFSQFDTLLKTVPLMSLQIKNSENAEYNNIIEDCKNCYLCMSTASAENSLYATLTGWLTNCIDLYWSLHSENCYELIDCDYCYESFFLQNCVHCSFSRYLQNCSHCANCIFCANLHNQNYSILNTTYPKEEYLQILESLRNETTFQLYYQQYLALVANQPLSNGNINSPQSFGGVLINSEHCEICFDTVEGKDCKYCATIGLQAVDCYDCGGGDVFQCSLCYEGVSLPYSYQMVGCATCANSHNLLYCDTCMHCSDCFGCVGLRNQQHCIFNKQYTQAAYQQLVPQLIEKMKADWERGEFFPMAISPFSYNETMAQDFYPHTSEEIKARKGKWKDLSLGIATQGSPHPLQWKKLAANDTTDLQEALQATFFCEVSGRPFKITKIEVDFYIKYGLPLPTKHPDIRHLERLQKRKPRGLHLRTCDTCQKEFLSVYEKGKHIVYCEECYSQKVYG